MSAKEQYKEDYIIFAEAGFIAINQADEDAAIKLFKAAELLDPSNYLPKIGMGYMHLCKLELKQAAKIFQDILDEDPHNDMAKTFLGISLSLNPKEVDQGEKVLMQTAKETHDPMVKDLAKNALDFVEKFVKKAAPPMQAPPNKSK
jgi:tetratricopeptide (TPR) repeat protein